MSETHPRYETIALSRREHRRHGIRGRTHKVQEEFETEHLDQGSHDFLDTAIREYNTRSLAPSSSAILDWSVGDASAD